ncbi:MAG: hypothetical protein Q7R96_05210 [Nanoarchaeota archaeon]|nr:hypothetical protein [Nanoarchaeota archaeon]
MEQRPSIPAMRRNILGIVRHVCLIEHFLHELQTGNDDPERPHDITGEHNKFELPFLEATAMQYEGTPGQHCDIIQTAIQKHRRQYHHKKFNLPNPEATKDDMELGAIDVICSLLEPDRTYQGGTHSYQTIADIIRPQLGHKHPWTHWALQEMQKLPLPNVLNIARLDFFPNIGLPRETYHTIRGNVADVLSLAQTEGYDITQ